MEDMLTKIRINKLNNQLMIHLSRKKLELKKNKNPKFIKIRKEDMIY